MQTVQHELPATEAVVNRFEIYQQDQGCQKQVLNYIVTTWKQDCNLAHCVTACRWDQMGL